MTDGAGPPHILFLCTGNAARSVMAAAMLAELRPDLAVSSSGTHVIEGQPMSWRTRSALEALDWPVPHHRSSQLRERDLTGVDLVVGLAVEHVAYIRRTHPGAADRTATLRRLAGDLPAGSGGLAPRVATLGLGAADLDAGEDVADPAGGELPEYVACAREVDGLVREFAARVSPG